MATLKKFFEEDGSVKHQKLMLELEKFEEEKTAFVDSVEDLKAKLTEYHDPRKQSWIDQFRSTFNFRAK